MPHFKYPEWNVTPRQAACFWRRVEKSPGCWRWTGRTFNNGYGQFQVVAGDVCRRLMAHRVAYTLLKGVIPEGKVIDHLCCNKWCVNPDHMEPVSQRENTMRGTSKAAINARKTHCPQGHPLEGDNLTAEHLRKGRRVCLICRRAKQNAAAQRRKENPQYREQVNARARRLYHRRKQEAA